MPNTHETLASLFSDIADAIRAKTGGTESITADNFPSAIAEISTGGGGAISSYTGYTPNVQTLNGYQELTPITASFVGNANANYYAFFCVVVKNGAYEPTKIAHAFTLVDKNFTQIAAEGDPATMAVRRGTGTNVRIITSVPETVLPASESATAIVYGGYIV
jgi:hypothetical protein